MMNLKGFGRNRSRFYSGIWQEGIRYNEKSGITGIPDEIRTENLPDMSPECHCYTNLLGK
jgi:hypothetical protein